MFEEKLSRRNFAAADVACTLTMTWSRTDGRSVHRADVHAVRPDRRTWARLYRSAARWSVSWLLVLGLIAITLGLYLLVALLRPEKFQ